MDTSRPRCYEGLGFCWDFRWIIPCYPRSRARLDAASLHAGGICGPGGEAERCWRTVASNAMVTTVVHEFATYDTHVYPIEIYAPVRHFLEDSKGASIKNIMAMGGCNEAEASVKGGGEARRFRRVMEFSLIATYLW